MTTFDKSKNKYNFSDDLIYFALDGLKKEGLLDETTSYVSLFAGMSRREVICEVGLASIITLPLIPPLVA